MDFQEDLLLVMLQSLSDAICPKHMICQLTKNVQIAGADHVTRRLVIILSQRK